MSQQGREVVIVEAVRTPIGRGHPEKGYYKDTHPNDLLGRCYTEVLDRAGVDASEVEDVIAGCVQQFGEQGFNVARNAWLQEGLPIEAAASTVDRQCGSAQQAVNFGAAQISAGAAAVLLMSREKADQLGLRPRARIVDQTTVGVDPVTMLTGPIPATQKILDRNGMKMSDVDTVEINEAFAPVVAAWLREHQPDLDRVNPRGGAMALGHPLGSSGARLITTLLHELEDEDKELGLVTMCCGGGLGTATLIRRV